MVDPPKTRQAKQRTLTRKKKMCYGKSPSKRHDHFAVGSQLDGSPPAAALAGSPRPGGQTPFLGGQLPSNPGIWSPVVWGWFFGGQGSPLTGLTSRGFISVQTSACTMFDAQTQMPVVRALIVVACWSIIKIEGRKPIFQWGQPDLWIHHVEKPCFGAHGWHTCRLMNPCGLPRSGCPFVWGDDPFIGESSWYGSGAWAEHPSSQLPRQKAMWVRFLWRRLLSRWSNGTPTHPWRSP